MQGSAAAASRELVLVGGGHTHVQVLRHAAMNPDPGAHITVVLDTPVAIYSGMVPGFVAGQYSVGELEIDVVPLARRAGARVILAAALAVDPVARRIELAGRPSIPYDVASLDIGSTVSGLELPGVAEHALPTRPIGAFVARVDEHLRKLASKVGSGVVETVIVGGGVGGIELAFCLDLRLRSAGFDPRVRILHSGAEILPGSPRPLVDRTRTAARVRGIEIVTGARVGGVAEGSLDLDSGERVDWDLLVWVTGAAPPPLLARSQLPLDDRGFVRVDETLQVEGYDDLFAVGDCATMTAAPWVPKAGVYAVRQGPVLTRNLRSRLAGAAHAGAAHAGAATLERYRPQRDFLALLNLGDGTALGAKWGRAFGGRWVMRLKDRIDRRFMRLFQVLDESGRVTAALPAMAASEAMLCGGCAAKLARPELEAALLRVGEGELDEDSVLGVADGDDVAAWMDGSRVRAASVDLFSAFTDDPWTVGRAAAANAVSDLYATGVVPRRALAIVALPESLDGARAGEALFQSLAGARSVLDDLGVALVGGHTTTATRLMVGFSIEGHVESAAGLRRKAGLRAGDALVLSRALGTGVLFAADMQGRLRGPWLATALDSVTRSNRAAWEAVRDLEISGMTDVTGFGLAGHLEEMLVAADLAARLEAGALPSLPGARELLSAGLESTAHAANALVGTRISWHSKEVAASADAQLLFDPQTGGGLLFGVAFEQAARAVAALQAAGEVDAAMIGRVAAKDVESDPGNLDESSAAVSSKRLTVGF